MVGDLGMESPQREAAGDVFCKNKVNQNQGTVSFSISISRLFIRSDLLSIHHTKRIACSRILSVIQFLVFIHTVLYDPAGNQTNTYLAPESHGDIC